MSSLKKRGLSTSFLQLKQNNPNQIGENYIKKNVYFSIAFNMKQRF